MDQLQDERDRVIDRLTTDYAEGLLSMSEFEERVDAVNRAETLPTIRAAGDFHVRQSPSERSSEPGEDEPEQTIIAILGERKLGGRWLHKRKATSVALLGSVKLDLRECDIQPGTEINVVTILGETVILLPDDVYVENDVTPILAEVNDRSRGARAGRGVRVRVSGLALMGEVKIRVG